MAAEVQTKGSLPARKFKLRSRDLEEQLNTSYEMHPEDTTVLIIDEKWKNNLLPEKVGTNLKN